MQLPVCFSSELILLMTREIDPLLLPVMTNPEREFFCFNFFWRTAPIMISVRFIKTWFWYLSHLYVHHPFWGSIQIPAVFTLITKRLSWLDARQINYSKLMLRILCGRFVNSDGWMCALFSELQYTVNEVPTYSTGELGYDRPLYDGFLHMTDGMLGPSPMHVQYLSYVYDGFCIWRTNFPGPIESIISKFTCTYKLNLWITNPIV